MIKKTPTETTSLNINRENAEERGQSEGVRKALKLIELMNGPV